VNPVIFLIALANELPPPPTSGSTGDDTEWWRIVGVLAITVVTVGIFAWIFKPTALQSLVETDDSIAPGPDESAELSADEVRPLEYGTLLPFRERSRAPDVSADEFTAAAATERLRRLTARSSPVRAKDLTERRRLGSRRTWLPGSEPLVDLQPPLNANAKDQEPALIGPRADVPVDDPIQEQIALETSNVPMPEADTTNREEMTETGEEMSDMAGQQEIDPTLPQSWEVGRDGPRPAGIDVDLLGDLVNRLPSVADRPTSESMKTMTGELPTAEEVDRLAEARPGAGKIVQFVPRAAKLMEPIDEDYQILEEINRSGSGERQTGSLITKMPVDAAIRESITSTVQELLFCANVGEFMHGFALYTDRYLFQFMTEAGFNEKTFRETFSAIPAKEPTEWTRIDRISDAHRMDDGRITAQVSYQEHDHSGSTEEFTFKLDQITQRWLIDGIQAV
jgi:hypothetical protein